MRKTLTILLLAVSLIAEADKWYIATAANGGSDTNGDGSISSPWLTLKHACDTVTGANFYGDTIVVGVGTFVETAQISVSEQVSIYGAGATSIISTSVSGAASPWDETAILLLSSASEGTSGSQSISYLAFNGNSYAGDAAILVYRRSDVDIHHCTVDDMRCYGVRFRGGAIPPTTYATGNTFHDNRVHDCGGPNVSYGNLQIGGQTDMLIYNNDIQQPGRPGTNQEGFPIKYLAGGHLRGLKIYDNILKCNYTGSDDHWHFSIELFGIEGGNEIYGNTCVGTIDYSGYVGNDGVNDDAGYGYAVKIYENTLGCDAPTDFETYGVTFERSLEGGTYIYRNIIRNVQAGLTFSNPSDGVNWRDVYVYNNLIYNIGQTDGASGGGILLGRLSDTYVLAINNWNFLNNVIADNSEGQATYGIRVRGGTSITYDSLIIRNNIITAITQGNECPIYLDHVNADIVSIENNCFYGSSTNNVVKASCVITSETTQNNITTDPLFVSAADFHLQSTSPARDAGIDVSAITGGLDFHGAARYGAAYDIGAFEYGVGRLVRIGTAVPTLNYKLILIDH
jgi:hypothetical protein